jgi:hypothetical protein
MKQPCTYCNIQRDSVSPDMCRIKTMGSDITVFIFRDSEDRWALCLHDDAHSGEEDSISIGWCPYCGTKLD